MVFFQLQSSHINVKGLGFIGVNAFSWIGLMTDGQAVVTNLKELRPFEAQRVQAGDQAQGRDRHASSEHSPKNRSKSGVGKCLASSRPKCLPTLRPSAISVFALFFVPAYPALRIDSTRASPVVSR